MTEIKTLKGSAFWFSPGSSLVSGVNLSDLYFDAAGSTITGAGQWEHDVSTPGKLTWTTDVFINSMIGDLTLTLPANNVTLADGEVAYLDLVRNQVIVGPTFTFTNASATVTSTIGAFTTFVVGDWIKAESGGLSAWGQIQSFNTGVPATAVSVVLEAVYNGASTAEAAVRTQGSYTMQQNLPKDVPDSADVYWIAKRKDNGGSIARLYIKYSGELEEGEELEISDQSSLDTLIYIGSTGETDNDPDYDAITQPSGSLAEQSFNTVNGESLTARLAAVTAMLADHKQDFNIEIDAGDIVWDGANVTISNAQLSIPGTTIGTAPVAITNLPSTALPDNSCYYVDINRTTAGSLALVQATLASLTPSEQRLVVARRLGTDLLVR